MITGHSLILRLTRYFRREPVDYSAVPSEPVPVPVEGVRLPVEDRVVQVELGRQRLWLYPEGGFHDDEERHPRSILVFDPDRYLSTIGSFLRLAPGQSRRIHPGEDDQHHLLSFPQEVSVRRFEITHEGNSIVLSEPTPELTTRFSLLDFSAGDDPLLARRHRALQRVVEIYGGPIEPLAPDLALQLLRDVTRLLENDPFRIKDRNGNPGGLIQLPPERIPILVGDLHARLDNLLTILSQNSFMEALQANEAALVFLGDAVHPVDERALAHMDSSVLMMDLILSLKRAFPKGIFYLLGNHDSFSPEARKGGVTQGVLWEKRLIELRGREYRDEMERFYRLSPLVALSTGFCACHAGPPQTRITTGTLENIRQFPELVTAITTTRQRTPGYPEGYTAGDVRQFRRALGLAPDTTFIVGHYPRSGEQSIWLNAGHVKGHHVFISERPDEVGLFTRIGDDMVPMVYPVDARVQWINDLARILHEGGGSRPN